MAKRLWRLFWLTVLVGHGILALAWWGLSPGGFRLDHPRFWTNRVAPPLVLGLSIAALAALRQERLAVLRILLPAWAAAWAAGAITLRIAFPVTMVRLWLVPLAAATAMGMAAIRPWRGPGERRWRPERSCWRSHPPWPVRPRSERCALRRSRRIPGTTRSLPSKSSPGIRLERRRGASDSIRGRWSRRMMVRSRPASLRSPSRSNLSDIPQRFPGRIADGPGPRPGARRPRASVS